MPALQAAFKDPRPLVRTGVMFGLRNLGVPEAEDTLRQAMNDPDPSIRHSATNMLRALEAEKTQPKPPK